MATQRINFPIFTTPLIGRDNDVATIVEQLRQSTMRFATLLGTSGTGKTRLSLQIASAMEADFPDGMAFISLAPISEPELVIPTIARTFNVTESATSTYQDTLSAYLRPLRMLLILDNFEQVISAAPAVAALIRDLPGIYVLCTSQVPATIPAEIVLPIPPLALPETNQRDPEKVAASPAVALFVDRMRQVQPYFQLAAHNSPAVVELCRRLNGLPLAIEMVATHSDRLQPEALLLLLRAYLPRERTRRNDLTPEQVIFPVLTWCVAYGQPAIRWLLPRLGVLRGEWRAEQAAAISANHSPSFDLRATLELMVNKGLLLALERNDETVYTMLDAIRQFAITRLEGDEPLAIRVRKRHMQAFALLAEQIDQGFRTGDALPMARHMTQAMPNIRAAIQRAFNQQQYDMAATIVKNLALPGYSQGYIRELLTWVERLEPFEDQLSASTQLGWFYGRGLLAYAVSNYATALDAYTRGLEHAREQGNLDYMARLLNNTAMIHVNQGHYPEARDAYEQSLHLREQEQNSWAQAVTLNNLGVVSMDEGDLESSLNYQQRALLLREELDDTQGRALSLLNIAEIKMVQEHYAEAEALLRQSITLQEQFEESVNHAIAYHSLGQLFLRRGDPAQASAAQQLLRSAISIVTRHEAQRELAMVLETYAEWLVMQAQSVEAARLLGYATALRTRSGAAFSQIQLRDLAAVRASIEAASGAVAREAAEIEGATMPLSAIIQRTQRW